MNELVGFYMIEASAIKKVTCFEAIFPFSNISNEELFETNQGKNIKFKVFTKKILDKTLNSEMMTAKYYKHDEASFLLKIYFFHLNIFSLPFHFDELIGLMTGWKQVNIDFLSISEILVKLNRNFLNAIAIPGFEHTPN